MRDSPPPCVVDANILIDLHVGGVLEMVFRLPLRLLAPDVVIAELHEPDGQKVVECGLGGIELSGDQVLNVMALLARYRSISASDLFALVLARAMGVPLLTGDRHLAQAAEEEGVPVHGTLWVLDEMVRLEVIPPSQAAQALKRMLSAGSRLPRAECHERLQQWQS